MSLIRIKKEYFNQIKIGLKRLEIRVAYPNLKPIKEGQIITLECGSDRLFVRIERRSLYSSFKEMLDNEDYNLIIAGKNKAEVLEICCSIYPPEKEKLGVLVFQVSVI